MAAQAQTADGIIKKEEHLLYLKSKFSGYDASLTLTASSLSLEAEDSGVLRRGVFQFLPFLKDKLEIRKPVFDLDFGKIKSVVRGSQGFNKNVLEVTDKQNISYRVTVSNYDEWAGLINAKLQ